MAAITSGAGRRPAVIFECVGLPGVIQQAIDGAPRGAQLVVVGVCMEPDRVHPFMAINKELSIQFALAYGPGASPLDHTPDEYISVEEFERGMAVLCEFLCNEKLGELANPCSLAPGVHREEALATRSGGGACHASPRRNA